MKTQKKGFNGFPAILDQRWKNSINKEATTYNQPTQKLSKWDSLIKLLSIGSGQSRGHQ